MNTTAQIIFDCTSGESAISSACWLTCTELKFQVIEKNVLRACVIGKRECSVLQVSVMFLLRPNIEWSLDRSMWQWVNTLIIIIFLSFTIYYTRRKTPANNNLPVLFFEFWQKKPLYNTGGSCILGYLLVHCNLPVG